MARDGSDPRAIHGNLFQMSEGMGHFRAVFTRIAPVTPWADMDGIPGRVARGLAAYSVMSANGTSATAAVKSAAAVEASGVESAKGGCRGGRASRGHGAEGWAERP